MSEHKHSSYSTTSYHPKVSHNLSFSSTLLEQICRSIDQTGDDEPVINSMRKKRDSSHANVRSVFKTEEQMANYQRACMIEKWMEKKVTEKIADIKLLQKHQQGSSSSSSDSSCGGFFSSSETESFPKPVRTGGELGKNHRNSEPNFTDRSEQKSKHESGFLKTKSRALKMYGDLKKVKQPISPGGKVAAFLNSIFTAGNLKKPKVAADSPSLKSTNASACSSVSSFSRSCLSKTKPSKSPGGGGKRSVRFSPASVTVDENNKHDVGFIRSTIDEEVMMRIMEKNRKVEEAARDFLMNYQKKLDQTASWELEFPFDELEKIDVRFDRELEEEGDEFDAESCASSDLFELDNLSAIGMDYREELPVYETTNIDKIQTMQMA